MMLCVFVFAAIILQGFVDSQDTNLRQKSCDVLGFLDLFQKQLNRLQIEMDELRQRSTNDNYCGVNEKQNGDYPQDCTELFQNGGRTTGVYLIKPSGSQQPFKVFCEMAYEGWTVFQRRFNGSVDFYRTWDEYKNGFGDLLGEHWLGNEKIHALTAQGSYILRFEMHTVDNTNIIAEYDGFAVEGKEEFYKLHLGTLMTTRVPIMDALGIHNNCSFTTWDQDHDRHTALNCAVRDKGGFWYHACLRTNPNGIYGCQVNHKCILWGDGYSNNLYGDETILKIKRK